MLQMWNERSLVSYLSYGQAFVDLYQAFMKGKDKQIETNFIDRKDSMDPDDLFFDDNGAVPLRHFDVSDFFEDPSGKIDYLIGDDNVCYD